MAEEVEYLLPYLASLLLSIGLTAYAWGRRNTPGVSGFVGVCASEAFWTLGFILEAASTGLQAKIFWDNLQFIAMFSVAISGVVMAYEYSQRILINRRRIWLPLSILPALCLPLIFLDPGQLMRPSSTIVPGDPFGSLYYPYSPLVLLMILYAYGGVLAAEVILVRSLFREKRFYSRQTLWLIAGITIPILGSVASVLELLPPAHRDIAPLTFALGNLVISVGLFRYGLFDVLPIARERVVENLSAAVVVVDSRERIVDFNSSGETLLGLSQADMGQFLSQVRGEWAEVVLDSDPQLLIRTSLETSREGSQSFLDLVISPIFESDERYIGRVVTVHDVTAQMRTQQELSKRTRQLETMNRELESFSYAVSHDLRAPLRSVRGFSQILLKEHPTQFEGEAGEMLRHISDAAAQMNELIDSLLSLSRQTRLDVVPGPVNLTELAQGIAQKLQEAEPSRAVTWSISDGLWATADERLMQTALENLLGNAWKYTGKCSQPAIEFGSQSQEGEMVYFVRDNGVGFDMQGAEDLFTPFRRLHDPSEFPGEGIGLATVQRIIHRHNGRIWAESQPEKGAVFYFTLG